MTPDEVTSVEPRLDGPLVVTGRIVVVGADGTRSEVEERVFLCRCGASGTKPRCDGTHKRTGFRAPGVPPPRKPGRP